MLPQRRSPLGQLTRLERHDDCDLNQVTHPFGPRLKTRQMMSIAPSYLLYYLPLIIAVSLVFGATRHEQTSLVLAHAWQTARWITGFMAIIFAVLFVIDWMI